MNAATHDTVRIGLLATSDRASQGVYRDEGIPALEEWLASALLNPLEFERRLVPDELPTIEATLKELVDLRSCDLVITTGGTGPAPRDVTPEATLAIAEREMPGFGEQMRRISLEFVPTAILSRQVAVIRGKALVLNLPGQPKSIRETLEGLKTPEGKTLVAGIFAAVPYCVDLLGGPYIETREAVVKAFRSPRHRSLAARPWSGRLGLRAHRARAAAARRPGAAIHLPARPGASGHDQQRPRDARLVRHPAKRHRTRARRGGHPRLAGRDRAPHRAREEPRGRRRQDRARGILAGRRDRPADGIAPSRAPRGHCRALDLPAARGIARSRGRGRQPRDADLHGPRHAGPGDPARPRPGFAACAAGARL